MDTNAYPLEFLYDGNCPICQFDVSRLRNADRKGRLLFIDISAADFDPEPYARTQEELVARIHARRADGAIVEGPEVMRLALTAIGLGWLAIPTRWPILKQFTDVSYDWFARHRTELSRRCGGLFTWLSPESPPECNLSCKAPKSRPDTRNSNEP